MKEDPLKKRDVLLVVISLLLIISINVTLIIVFNLKGNTRVYNQAKQVDASILLKPLEMQRAIDAPQEKKMENHKIPIIVYHYIEYVKDPADTIRQKLNTNPKEFERQLELYKVGGYETYFLRDVPHILDGTIRPTKKPIVLTFDDGYEDFYTDALPILQKHQMKATPFIVPNFIGKHNYMSQSQFLELIKSPLVEIASHTMDHVSLKGATTAVIKYQVGHSKEVLENQYGLKVDTFAYPYGSISSESAQLIKEAGYTAAVSEIYGSIQSEKNLYFLSRIRPGMFYGATTTVFLDSLEK